MLSFQTHPKEIKDLQNQIASGKFFSLTFIKKDGSIRYLNGHRKFPDYDSPDAEKRGKWDRTEKNILTVWDNNAPNYRTGGKGDFRSVALERLLFAKVGNFEQDFSEENADAIQAAGITPEQLQQAKQKMKIGGMVQEEMLGMIKEAEFFSVSDVPEYVMRMGFDENGAEILKKLGIEAFQRGGDSEFVKWFKAVTGQEVYPVSKGRYSFTPVS